MRSRVLVWFAATTPLWVVGATTQPWPWLAWWAAAAVIHLTGTWLAHPLPRRVTHSELVAFDGKHMIERLRLFLIIALGEAVLTTGTAIAARPNHPPTVLAGLGGLSAVVALWSLYFAGSNPLVRAHFGRPLLCLGGQSWYLGTTSGRTLQWLWAACVAQVLGGLAVRELPASASLVVLPAILASIVATTLGGRQSGAGTDG